MEQPVLGSDRTLLTFHTLDEVVRLGTSMAEQARRYLDIVSRDLEPRLYDQQGFLDAVRRLAIRSRYVRIRFLATAIEPAVRNDHRLIELSRRLSSFIEIRRLSEDDSDFNQAFLIADQVGYLWRAAGDRYEGEASFYNPLRADELLRVFEGLWERSEIDPNLRRLHI